MYRLSKLLARLPSRVGDTIIKVSCGKKQGYSRLLRQYYAEKYHVAVGEYSYGGCFKKDFNCGGRVSIGRYCSIAGDVHYFGANHPIDNVSTSAFFYNRKMSKLAVNDVERSELVIGDDVWIGYGVILTSKCHQIGTGAVIGAGSIVTHDVPPNTVVAGNPARIIRTRLPKETFEKLEHTRWSSMTPKMLMNYYQYMKDPERFVEEICKENNKERL